MHICGTHFVPNSLRMHLDSERELSKLNYLQLKRVDFPEHPSDRSVSTGDEESQGGQPPEHLKPDEEESVERILRCERRRNSVKTGTDSLEQIGTLDGY